MITLRFERHNGGAYEIYSCERYNVTWEYLEPENEPKSEIPPDSILRKVVRMFRTLSDVNPYHESVGDREPNCVAYAMNEHGKTIDTIR